jgi:hypothetical protein
MKVQAKLIFTEDMDGNVCVDMEFTPGMGFQYPSHVRALQLYDLAKFIQYGILTNYHMDVFNELLTKKCDLEKAVANGKQQKRENHPEI